ncbi:MAG: signal peptidase I [bacterium]
MVELKNSQNSEEQDEDDKSFDCVDDTICRRSKFTSFFLFLGEVIKTVLISLAIILPVRYFIIQPFYVKGASMEPNFLDKDYLIINEFIYKFKEPERGDIIVFKNPRNPEEFFIKRVIGLPGEKVKVFDNRIEIYNEKNPQGIVINEPYLQEGRNTRGTEMEELGKGEYYVFGDNRDKSLDSRTFGAISEDSIVGKVWLRGWPLDRFSIFKHEDYNL